MKDAELRVLLQDADMMLSVLLTDLAWEIPEEQKYLIHDLQIRLRKAYDQCSHDRAQTEEDCK